MKRHYTKIHKKDKGILYLVEFHTHSQIQFELIYNSVSSTYMGLMINSFIDTIRGFLRIFPNFLEEVSDYELEKWLKENEFEYFEPTEMQKLLYL